MIVFQMNIFCQPPQTDMDDGETCIDVGLDQITPAFPVGTRVAIDWDSDGHWVYGVVTAFNQLWYVTFINVLFSYSQ